MRITIKTKDYEIRRLPFEDATTIDVHDYDDSNYEEMREILLELGAKTHKNKRLSKWYCDNAKD